MVQSITIFMKGAPYSDYFDDIYFSKDDGLAETQHVFLNGNNLPATWQGKESFSIFETGFGTGLNFFAVWDLFEKNADENQTLDFVSIEKYPLSPETIKKALEPWSALFKDKIETLCNLYPIRMRGTHRIKISKRVTLTLIFDDVNDALPTLTSCFDCWFLDGFTPAKNPDMWSQDLFEQMARLSKSNASFATFTAAGDVRRGLQAVGFDVQKSKGFGHKRDMIVGTFQGEGKLSEPVLKPKNRIAVIGGGLSGTACAYVLKQYGYEPVIYEATDSLASGSGNECGFYNPRFCTLWDFSAQFYAPAYAQFITLARQFGDDFDYNPCGGLSIIDTPDKEKRFKTMLETWSWHQDHARIVSPQEASEIANISINHEALYLPDSGSVHVKKLCAYYAKDIEVHYNSQITDIESLDAEAVIICNAHYANQFDFITDDMTQTIRGQVSKIKTTTDLKDLSCHLHFDGYISKNFDGYHYIGSTFERNATVPNITDEDHQRNTEKINSYLGAGSKNSYEVVDGWAGIRTATKDRFPIVGKIPSQENTYISLAFGSHGIVGSLQAGHILADLLRENTHCLQFEMKKNIHYQRFNDRLANKG